MANLEDAKASGFRALDKRGLVAGTKSRGVKLVSDLSQTDSEYTEYLLGHEPTWSDLQNSKVAIRQCFHDLWDEINKVRSSISNHEIILVTGTAGVGKSSAIMWAALKLHADGIIVGWIDANIKLTHKELINSINEIEEIGALFINDADIYGANLSRILCSLLTQKPVITL